VQARSLDWNGGMLMRRDHAADWVAMDEEQLLERA